MDLGIPEVLPWNGHKTWHSLLWMLLALLCTAAPAHGQSRRSRVARQRTATPVRPELAPAPRARRQPRNVARLQSRLGRRDRGPARRPSPAPAAVRAPQTRRAAASAERRQNGRAQAKPARRPSRARLLTGERSAAEARIDLVSRARSEINMSTFIFADDRAGRAVMAQLARAARSGKKVRLLMDAVGKRIPDEAVASLLKAGVEVGLYNPPSLLSLFMPHRLSYRLHDKLLIVDGRQLMLGGRNIEDGYYGIERAGAYQFADTDVHVSGSSAAAANRYFMDLWNSRNVRVLNPATFRAARAPVRAFSRMLRRISRKRGGRINRGARADWERLPDAAISSIRFVHDGAREVRKDTERTRATILRMIAHAEREVEIQTPYLIPDEPLLDAIRAATKRGVQVRLITNSRASSDGKRLAYLAYESQLPTLARAGAQVWEYNGKQVLHSKTVVVDGRKVFIGSHNLDPRSARMNREVGVLVRSTELARQVEMNGKDRRQMSTLVADRGSIAPLRASSCGVLCHRLGGSIVRTLLAVTGLYRQL